MKEMMKNNKIRKALLIASAIAVTCSCFGCAGKTKTTTTPYTSSPSASSQDEPAETNDFYSRAEGTSSGEYQDVLYIPTTDADGHGPTGVVGVITPAQIMVNGKIYKYQYDGMKYLPDGFEEIGKILQVNDFKKPEKDFFAAGPDLRLRSGQPVYASKDNEKRVVILCEDGYYFLTCD